MRRISLITLAAALWLAFAAQADGLFDIVTKGSTDRSVTVDIIDSTDGTPETGVVFNTSGIDLWYRREGAAVTSITEATLAALTTAHSDGGFLQVANGKYRLDLPDAAFATGANYVDFGGTVPGMIVIGGRVRLVDANLEVANLAANVTQYNGVAATSSGGRPEVNASHWGGTAVASARPLVDTVQFSGDAGAADRFEAILDGTCGAYPELGVSRGVGCTAQAYTAGTPSITLDASAAFGDNTLRGAIIMICGSTQGYCQPAVAASNVGSTDIVTLEQALPVTPSGTITFTIYAVPASSGVDVKKINGSSVCGTGATGDLWTKCP